MGAFGVRLSADSDELLVDERFHFGVDDAQRRPESQPLLDELTRVVLRNGHLGTVRIEVHSEARGSSARNLELTRERAEALRAHLEAAGVPSARLRAIGFGEQRPISHCPEGNPRCNRRVELHLERELGGSS